MASKGFNIVKRNKRPIYKVELFLKKALAMFYTAPTSKKLFMSLESISERTIQTELVYCLRKLQEQSLVEFSSITAEQGRTLKNPKCILFSECKLCERDQCLLKRNLSLFKISKRNPRIVPDVIFHNLDKQGSANNFLVCELKIRNGLNMPKDCLTLNDSKVMKDRAKLSFCTCQKTSFPLHYQHGALVFLWKDGCVVEWYRDGKCQKNIWKYKKPK